MRFWLENLIFYSALQINEEKVSIALLLTHLVKSDSRCTLLLTLWQLKNIKSDFRKKEYARKRLRDFFLTRRAQGQNE